MVFYVSKDDGTVTAIAAASGVPTEVDSTNAKGDYKIALSQAETNADKLRFTGKSSTAGIVVIPQTIYTVPANFTKAVIDSAGLQDANVVKVGPSGSGTAQTARDIGASVLLSVGTGTGQLDFTSGVVKANTTQIGGVTQTGGDVFAAVSNIAVTGAALNTIAAGATYTTGSSTGGYTNTFTADGVYDSVADATGTIDFYYQFSLGSTGQTAVGADWLGYVVGVVNTIKAYAYNWGAAGWDQVASIVGISGTANMSVTMDLTSAHTGTGGNLGLVRIRFAATGLVSATVKTDRILVGYTVVTVFPTNFGTLAIDGSGRVDLGKVVGNAQTADANGLLKVDVEDFGGTAGTFSGGKAAVKLTNTDVTGNVASDLQTIKTQVVTCAAGVTVAPFVGNATHVLVVDSSGSVTFNNTSIATVTTVTNQLTQIQIAAGVWQDTTSGHFTVSGSIGQSLFTGRAPGDVLGGLVANNTVASFSAFAVAGSTTLNTLSVSSTTTLSGVVTATNAGNSVVGITAALTGDFTSTMKASIPTAIGMGAANMDTQLNAIYTVAGDVQSQTDKLEFNGSGNVAASAGGTDFVHTSGKVWALDGSGNAVSAASAVASLQTTANTINVATSTNLDINVGSRAPSSTALSTANWTSARAGYLDNLNVGGNVASHADIVAINQSASKHISVATVGQYAPGEAYTIEVRTFSAATGAAVDADSTPTISVTGSVSGDLSANLSAVSHIATGVYQATYTVPATPTLEQITCGASATIATLTFTLNAFTQTVDQPTATFTATDKSNLTSIFNKLPTHNIADETVVLAAIGTPMQAYTQPTGFLAATFPGTVASPTNITAGTLTTVANLTNAPTVGDFTATMKTSIGTAVAASAVSSVTGNIGGNVTGNVSGNVVGSVGSVVARVTSNTDQLAGQTVTAATGVTFPTSVGTSTVTQAQITGGAFALNNASFAFNSSLDLTSTQKTSVTSAVPTTAAIAPAVWANVTRTLTSGGGGGGITAEDVWTYTDRVLTAGTNLNDLSASDVRTAVGLGSADLDSQLSAIHSDTGTALPNQIAGLSFSTLTADDVWTNPTRTLTAGGGGGGATPEEIWTYTNRTLTSGGGGGSPTEIAAAVRDITLLTVSPSDRIIDANGTPLTTLSLGQLMSILATNAMGDRTGLGTRTITAQVAGTGYVFTASRVSQKEIQMTIQTPAEG